jgi:IclR family acetate operon transcriptional repressor
MSMVEEGNGGEALLGCVQSLVRAFGLLDRLADCDGMGLSEVARAVNLPRSTAHRLLSTMEALHYVRFDRESNRWCIGHQAFKVGAAFAQTRDLGEIGRGMMRSLLREVNHCVNVAVPEAHGVCYVDQAIRDGFRQTVARPGAVLPMHTTASGKVIMANWSPLELDRYLAHKELRQRTERTLVNSDRLRAELALVRERGYAIDDQEHEDGLRCVAALVRGYRGDSFAALSVSDRVASLDRLRMDELGPMLVSAARRLSDNLDLGALSL